MDSDLTDFDEESESADYILSPRDRRLLAAARLLLDKVVCGNQARPAQLVSVAKLQHVLTRMPKANIEMDLHVSVSSPERSFDDVRTFHWWDVTLENGALQLSSGGHFYRPSTGGDTFTSVIWEVAPGEEASFSDFSEQHQIVPDLRSYEDGVATINFDQGGYSIEVTDSDNPLLEESDEEPSEDDLAPEHEDFVVIPIDPAEIALVQRIDQPDVHSHEPSYAHGVEQCDFCKCSLTSRGIFVDGQTTSGPWANMCVPCFNVRGVCIGWGSGQVYARQPNGDWRLVAGFRPPDPNDAE